MLDMIMEIGFNVVWSAGFVGLVVAGVITVIDDLTTSLDSL